MNKIKTLNDLRRMRETMQASLDLREKSNAPDQPVQEAYTASPCTKAQGDGYEILVCGGTGCRASQSAQIMENLQTAIEKAEGDILRLIVGLKEKDEYKQNKEVLVNLRFGIDNKDENYEIVFITKGDSSKLRGKLDSIPHLSTVVFDLCVNQIVYVF